MSYAIRHQAMSSTGAQVLDATRMATLQPFDRTSKVRMESIS